MAEKKCYKLSQRDITAIESELNKDKRVEIAPGKDEAKVYVLSRQLVGTIERDKKI